MRIAENKSRPGEQSAGFTLITGANSGIGLELARQAAAEFSHTARIAPASYMATTKTTPAEVAPYTYRMMKRGKPIAVYSLSYKLLTSLLVRITPRFALRRLLRHLNAQGNVFPSGVGYGQESDRRGIRNHQRSH
jgi:short-subunit dehydrogenase